MTRRRRRSRLVRRNEALRGIYLDFEGQIDADPALLGMLLLSGDEWRLTQYVTDDRFVEADDGAPGVRRHSPLPEAVHAVFELSDDEKRPIITWSEHDLRILKAVSGDRPFRHRNAIRTAKRWRKTPRSSDDGVSPNSLAHFERFIGYDRPQERHGVGEGLAYIADRQSATDGAIARWQTILEHNRHDLLAMRDVMFKVTR